jgi:hypothetical protein
VVRDLCFTAQGTNWGTGLALIGASSPSTVAPSLIINCSFRGSDGYAVTNYWSYGLYLQVASNVQVYSCIFCGGSTGGGYATSSTSGVGIQIIGFSTYYAYDLNINGSNFLYLSIGLSYASQVQGVTVSQSNFTGGYYGIYCSGSGLSGLAVSVSQFNSAFSNIWFNNSLAGFAIADSQFYIQPTGYSIATTTGVAVNEGIIHGNNINGNATQAGNWGVYLQGVNWTVICDNVFYNLGGGIGTTAACSNLSVHDNLCTTVVTPYSLSGTALHTHDNF